MSFVVFPKRIFFLPFLFNVRPARRFSGLRFVLLLLLLLSSTAIFADVGQSNGEDSRRLQKQAQKFTKKRQFDEAEKLLRRAAEISPQESNIRLDLAHLLNKQRRLNDAYNLAVDVARREPQNGRAFAVLGSILLGAGNFRDAKTSVYNALTLNRREALAWAVLGMIDFYENRVNKSLDNLYEANHYDSQEPDYVYALAQVAARAEKYKESADAYRRFLVLSPDEDKERRERIKGLIGFLSYLGNKEQLYVLDGQNKTKISFDLTGNRPIIELKVNNKEEPLRFVLDTGSGISVISNETAARLKIKEVARGGSARGIGGDGKFEIVYGFLKSVNIGDTRIKNVPVYIRKFHVVNEKIDGYIGLSLISKFLTTIDYGDLTFSLTKKSALENKQTNDNNDLSLPLRLTSSGFLSGEVQLEGVSVPLNFIVDTGASVSVISHNLAGSPEVGTFARGEKMRVVGAAGITEDVPSFLLPRVTFGTHSRESVSAIALDLDLINETSGFEQAGILGGNFLRNYRLTFDFESSKVIFVPIKK